jgi:hypothetical protein
MSNIFNILGIHTEHTRFSITVHRFRDSLDSLRIGYFIKMGRFDKTLEGFRKDSMSHGKTCVDISKVLFQMQIPISLIPSLIQR